MGRVVKAYDPRLDRRVAIKLIRHERSTSQRARQRFRREARLVAALNHPSVIQIHDILDTPEGDALVMELVDGRSLADILQEGPVALPVALQLIQEITAGLGTAHRQGIVHRDLKPGNVMVTTEGQAKLLDFGLAKRRSLLDESEISHEEERLGTPRWMSPEQILGQEPGPQSDLFSLGVLFYELVTGAYPFESRAGQSRWQMICQQPHPSALSHRPDLDPRLATLIDRLLHKEPMHRPKDSQEVLDRLDDLSTFTAVPTAASPTAVAQDPTLDGSRTWEAMPPSITPSAKPEVAESAAPQPVGTSWWNLKTASASFVLIGLAVFGWFLATTSNNPPDRAVVALRPDIGEGSESQETEILRIASYQGILSTLLSFENMVVLPPERAQDLGDDPAKVARAIAADDVLSTQIDCQGPECLLILQRFGSEGDLLWTDHFMADPNRPWLLEEALAGYLRQGFQPTKVKDGWQRNNVRPEDYERYLQLRYEFDTHEETRLDSEQFLFELEQIRLGSPRFVEAYVLTVDILLFQQGHRSQDVGQAQVYRLLQQAQELAPFDPRPATRRFQFALKQQDFEEATRQLAVLDRIAPGDATTLGLHGLLERKQGNTEPALRLLEQAVARRPSFYWLFQLAWTESQSGRSDQAREHLNQLLERHPGHFAARSLLAQIELLNGSLERAVTLYSQLVETSPQVTELSNLGTALMLNRQFEAADVQFQRALALDPDNPFLLLNAADSLVLAEKSGAEALYRRVAEHSSLLDDWQSRTVKAQALAHLGEKTAAVQHVQEALRQAPGHEQAAYEASLVYSLTGELTSARVNARQALDLGMNPVFFSLPWFESLHDDPELAHRLQRKGTPTTDF